MLTHKIYHLLKPLIPRKLQISLRRQVVLRKRGLYKHVWPIDEKASKPPENWSGWPDGKSFALLLTHDVEKANGQEKCVQLGALEETVGFRSSFNFVAEGYHVSAGLRSYLTDNGFEIGIHGLTHKGNPFRSRKIFQEQAIRINQYLTDWKCVGYRSPSMYHNLGWIGELNIDYDASTFDTDPFEPQPDGMGTIFPIWVSGNSKQKGYVELPYTLSQDFTLFILMKERNIGIWKKKLDWIAENGGMALLNTHPDYMNFEGKRLSVEEYPAHYYREFLEYVRHEYKGQYWHVLPKELAKFWKQNQMKRQTEDSIH
jgi:peptidoglycan/xylan/chitin deacetylase (PgdA/CDA1 family)